MQKVSLRKLSLLGLVLMGASAVTAAVLPAVKEGDKYGVAGSLTVSTANFEGDEPGLTCELDTLVNGLPAITAPCNITADSGTTFSVNNPTTDGNGDSTAAPDVDNP